MNLFSRLLEIANPFDEESKQKRAQKGDEGGLFSRLRQVAQFTPAGQILDPESLFNKKVRPTGEQLVKGAARSVPRFGANIVAEIDPSKRRTPEPGFEQAILGREPIEGLAGQARQDVSGVGSLFGNPELGKNLPGAAALPLGILLGIGDVSVGGSGRKQVIKALTKTDDIAEASRLLKTLGVTEEAIPDLAPKIAKVQDVGEVSRLVEGATGTPKTVPQIGESTVKSFDITQPGGRVAQASTELAPRGQGALEAIKGPPIHAGTRPLEVGADKIAQKSSQMFDSYYSFLPEPPSPALKRTIFDPTNPVERKIISTWGKSVVPQADTAARFFGDTGVDMVYKLADATDTHTKILEDVRPLLEDIAKGSNKVAKTKLGRRRIGEQIARALQDRARVDEIITDPQARELYDKAEQVFDYFTDLRQRTGRRVIRDDYSTRGMVKQIEDTQAELFGRSQSAFNPDVTAPSSRPRVLDENEMANTDVFQLLPGYVNSQAKEISYSDAIDFIEQAYLKVDPIHLTNQANVKTGTEHMKSLMAHLINPERVDGKAQKIASFLVGRKYAADLRFNPKVTAQNRTQPWIANAFISKEARKLASSLNKLPEETKTLIDSKIIAIKNAVVAGEAEELARRGKLADKIDHIDPFFISEQKNIRDSYYKGVAEAAVKSEEYKALRGQGVKPIEAITQLLESEDFLGRVVRKGNVLTHDTQFNANAALKPEFFSKKGDIFGVPISFLKQYRTYQSRMMRQVFNGLKNDGRVRELNILKEGDPRAVGIVNQLYSAQAVQEKVSEIQKSVRKGEIPDLNAKEVDEYAKALKGQIKLLESEILKLDPFRRATYAKQLAKVWAVSFGLQMLFDGAYGAGEAALSSMPGNIPTRGEDITSPRIPILETITQHPEELVPFVGPVIKRGRQFDKLFKTLSGQSSK